MKCKMLIYKYIIGTSGTTMPFPEGEAAFAF